MRDPIYDLRHILHGEMVGLPGYNIFLDLGRARYSKEGHPRLGGSSLAVLAGPTHRSYCNKAAVAYIPRSYTAWDFGLL